MLMCRTMLERLVNLVVKPFNLPVKKKKRGRLETKEDSATYPWFQSGARGREHVPVLHMRYIIYKLASGRGSRWQQSTTPPP